MTKKEKMEVALGYASESMSNGECPIGAALFLDDELICGCGSCGETKMVFLAHAEMNVLMQADRMAYSVADRKRMQLYTTLEPCLMCMGAALSFYVGEIVYALESEIDGAVLLVCDYMKTHEVKEISSYSLPAITYGVHREKSILLLEKFALAYPGSPAADFCRSVASTARRRDNLHTT
jgi:tRNA(adenine34) deaminase